MQELIEQLLVELGEDPSREGLLNTPKRVEKALRFLTSGYDADIDEVLNSALFTVDYSEMVIVKDIDFYSLCEHHCCRFSASVTSPTFRAQGHRPEQDSAARGRVQPPPADAGAAHEPDRRHDSREDRAARRGRRHGSDASLHVDARRREAELVRGDERHARRVSQTTRGPAWSFSSSSSCGAAGPRVLRRHGAGRSAPASGDD